MPAARSRPRRHAWCRRQSPSTITASAAGTNGPRRAGRPRRRPRTKGSPQRWHGSTTLRDATRLAARRCDEARWAVQALLRTPRYGRDRNELPISTRRDRRPAARCGWLAAGPDPRGPATSSARRGARAGRRPVERRRADGARRPARFLSERRKVAAGLTALLDLAALPAAWSPYLMVRHQLVLEHQESLRALAERLGQLGARRCRRRRAARAAPDRSRRVLSTRAGSDPHGLAEVTSRVWTASLDAAPFRKTATPG